MQINKFIFPRSFELTQLRFYKSYTHVYDTSLRKSKFKKRKVKNL